MTADNTYIRATGKVECRECRKGQRSPDGKRALRKQAVSREIAVVGPAKDVTTKVLIDSMRALSHAAMTEITQNKLERASAGELMRLSGLAIDKLQLLEGKPTAIMGHAERRTLNELIPAIMVEAKRRGLTLEGDFKDVTP